MNAVVQLDAARAVAGDAPRPVDLLALARSRTSEDRQRLLLGVTALCRAAPPSPEAAVLMGEVFMTLARQAERDIRRILSETLADADWAPPALINMLALDEIEIARPVIAASPLLKDADLIRVLVEATIEHQIEVARRPNLSGRVADAVIQRGDPAGLTALASNRTAEISEDGLRRLVDHSRRIAALRAPLTRHPRLTDTMGEQLYQWVGQALRQAIAERFRIDNPALDLAVREAASQAAAGLSATGVPLPTDGEREEMDRRLIAKLHGAGQLRAGFLIRAVRECRMGLFEQGLAALGNFPLAHVRRALEAATPEPLFYACTAVGIDRAVFPALLAAIRKLGDGSPGVPGAFWSGASMSPPAAARAFRALMAEPVH